MSSVRPHSAPQSRCSHLRTPVPQRKSTSYPLMKDDDYHSSYTGDLAVSKSNPRSIEDLTRHQLGLTNPICIPDGFVFFTNGENGEAVGEGLFLGMRYLEEPSSISEHLREIDEEPRELSPFIGRAH